jgi:hypothetical protein
LQAHRGRFIELDSATYFVGLCSQLKLTCAVSPEIDFRANLNVAIGFSGDLSVNQ